MEEIWKQVTGYEARYQISSLGRIKSLLTHRLLQPSTNKNGYKMIPLHLNGKSHTHYLHHLVATAFIGERPVGLHICHNDGNKSNNVASNLRYDTRSANEIDKARHGTSNRGEGHGMSKAKAADIPLIRQRILVGGERAEDVSRDFGLSARAVTHIANRTRWSHIP